MRKRSELVCVVTISEISALLKNKLHEELELKHLDPEKVYECLSRRMDVEISQLTEELLNIFTKYEINRLQLYQIVSYFLLF